MPTNSEWICNNCYSVMNVKKEGRNRYLIECPNCDTYWYVDKDGEMINDDNEDYEDYDYELADYCRGGDLSED